MDAHSLVSLVLLLGCTVWLGLRGYDRGVIRSLQRFVALFFAYLACYFLMIPLGKLLHGLTSWSLVLCYVLSGVVCLFIVGAVVEKIIDHGVEALEARGIEPAKIPGALLGASFGFVIGILLVWLSGVLFDLYRLQQQPQGLVASRDPVRAFAGNLVSGVVQRSVVASTGNADSLVPALTGQLVGDPLALTQRVTRMSQSNAMRSLFSDPVAQQWMLTDNIEALKEHPNFVEVMSLPDSAEVLAVLAQNRRGAKEAAAISEADRVAHLLAEMYRRVYRVQNDPRFVALSQKPEFKQLAQNPSPVALLSNPMLNQLAEIIFDQSAEPTVPLSPDDSRFKTLAPLQWQKDVADPATSSTERAAEGAEDQDSVPMEVSGTVMYRWTDENGQKHYSETRPEGNEDVEVIRLSP